MRSLHEFFAVDEDEIRVKDSARFTSLKEVGEHLGVDQLVNRDLLVSLFKIGD